MLNDFQRVFKHFVDVRRLDLIQYYPSSQSNGTATTLQTHLNDTI